MTITVTVNVTELLVPPPVVTVTWRAPAAALAAIVKLVVNEVAFDTLTAPTVTPAPAFTVVAPTTKFVPVRVTLTTVPAHGQQRLIWRNPSSDTIQDLWFHLYLNAFKDENSTFYKPVR